MKLDFLDTYSIRARLSASVILFAPVAITMFLCFEDVFSFASSSVVIALLLAFANYIPIYQRRRSKKLPFVNYAAQYLRADDDTFDPVSKERFYRILGEVDNSFRPLQDRCEPEKHADCCRSAVDYLRNHTRDNHLVQEENINYGFCKNLLASKWIGVFICIGLCFGIGLYSWLQFGSLKAIPHKHYLAFAINLCMIAFWCFGVTKKTLDDSAKAYGKTLIRAIDTLGK